ncbi:DUF2922 domain-containing protein [Clostridium botulinum]|uniref:DUF2922 domain-containing protein n=1 Tax=Clostridium botulinum TaxID=1491 RepID=A0A6B4JIJ3_CLOBO|nr:DUF2922 domain-containing protein [Clostridium botulinum]EES50358.1 conserved hypothetical protein [Clostridium botulinum E1 str. 'BoNT E Beluga']MBY6760023.1 DUF2922 domain-containing protein [Clostridium botulinum]MBY6918932.1 DUF2922 domain-containing protein [Clostridium botulinum]MCR1132579.1 DUF2922 domain-containing protein [Clostridium botulinum]NFJ56733.1 DUF2922 domain-containing protein [Clostridium botulinum]
MEYNLSLIFLNTIGSKSSLTITDVKQDITADEVKALMNLIVEKDFFLTGKGSFVKPDSAQLVQREVKKFEIK